MADDEWQLEAVHEQFNVLETFTTPHKEFHSCDLHSVMIEVAYIKNCHLKMDKPYTQNPRIISSEIIKHPDGNRIKLSFVVIVTNIESNNRLCKMPIFVLICGDKKKYIDMNLTVFNSWKEFLNNNNLPPCQFCFPVNGEYSVGGTLKIDFASSPIAMRQNVNFMWRSLGFVVAVGLVVGSFFFKIPEISHSKAGSLMKIAEDFVPGIKKYMGLFLRGVVIVKKLQSGEMSALDGLHDLWLFMRHINDEFSEEISYVFNQVRSALWNVYSWLKAKLSYYFKKASKWAQDNFVAAVWRVNGEIATIEAEAAEILEGSRENHLQPQANQVAAAIHAYNGDSESGRGYADAIFKNAKVDSALQNGMEKGIDDNVNPKTLELLEISNSIAPKLGKNTLKDVQDTFEALSSTVKSEYKRGIKTYSRMLDAARAGAVGNAIDIEVYNQTLGIEGSVTEYYWQEAIISVMKDCFAANRFKREIEKLAKERKILILPVSKRCEDSVEGLYRLGGINGAGELTANELINALKEKNFDLSEDFAVNESNPMVNHSMVVIQAEEFTFTAMTELNEENTSEGMLFVVKNGVHSEKV